MDVNGYDFAPVVALLTTGVYEDFDLMAELANDLSEEEARQALIALLGMTVELMDFVCQSADVSTKELLMQIGLDNT